MNDKAYPAIKNSILLCLLFLGVQIGLGLIIGILQFFFMETMNSSLSRLLNNLGSVAAFILVLLIGFKKTKRSFNDVFKLNKVALDQWVATIIFMFGFIIVSSELDNLLNFVLPMPEIFRSVFDSLMVKEALVLSILYVGIIPAISEELMFRGLILDGLQRNYSSRKAIVVSALLFGLIHLNPWQALSAFLIGLVSAWICIKTNSILLPMFIHFFNNTLSTLAVRYGDVIQIRGFSSSISEWQPGQFQPLWFDGLGIVLTVLGIYLLLRSFVKHKQYSAEPAVELTAESTTEPAAEPKSDTTEE